MDIELLNITAEDLEQIRSWRNSPDISRFLYTDQEITAEQQLAWFEKIGQSTTSKYWIVAYNGKKIGLAYLSDISTLFDSCSWAFYIGDPEVRGSGVGFKIEYNIINYVFETLKLNKLVCEVFTFNDGVIRMHELFGFRREGYFRQHVKKNGRYEDVVRLALLKTEWNMVRDMMKKRIYRTP